MLERKMRQWFAEREAVGEAIGEVKTLRRVLVAYLQAGLGDVLEAILQAGLGDVLEAIRVLIANSANVATLESLRV